MNDTPSIEKELSKGAEAFKDGRFPEAISSFEQVLSSAPGNISAQEGLFSALRLVRTDKFLIDRFTEKMGFTPDYYKGFSLISDTPTEAASLRRLNELAGNLSPDDGFPFHMGVVLDADALAHGKTLNSAEWVALENEIIRDRDTVDENLIHAKTLVASGHYVQAIPILSAAIKASPNSLAYQLLAFAQSHCGIDYRTTLLNYSFAHIFPANYWGTVDSHGGRLRSMGRYGKFKMYCYIAPPIRQFYAIPDDVDARLGFDGYWANTKGGGVELYAPRIPYSYRIWLKSVIPKSVIKMLQWIVSLKVMTSIFSGQVELDSMALNKDNIGELLQDIQDSKD